MHIAEISPFRIWVINTSMDACEFYRFSVG
jgi:hypothetical protein